jgi:hypothetical protein
MEDGTTIKFKLNIMFYYELRFWRKKIMRQQKAISKIGVLQDGQKSFKTREER